MPIFKPTRPVRPAENTVKTRDARPFTMSRLPSDGTTESGRSLRELEQISLARMESVKKSREDRETLRYYMKMKSAMQETAAINLGMMKMIEEQPWITGSRISPEIPVSARDAVRLVTTTIDSLKGEHYDLDVDPELKVDTKTAEEHGIPRDAGKALRDAEYDYETMLSAEADADTPERRFEGLAWLSENPAESSWPWLGYPSPLQFISRKRMGQKQVIRGDREPTTRMEDYRTPTQRMYTSILADMFKELPDDKLMAVFKPEDATKVTEAESAALNTRAGRFLFGNGRFSFGSLVADMAGTVYGKDVGDLMRKRWMSMSSYEAGSDGHTGLSVPFEDRILDMVTGTPMRRGPIDAWSSLLGTSIDARSIARLLALETELDGGVSETPEVFLSSARQNMERWLESAFSSTDTGSPSPDLVASLVDDTLYRAMRTPGSPVREFAARHPGNARTRWDTISSKFDRMTKAYITASVLRDMMPMEFEMGFGSAAEMFRHLVSMGPEGLKGMFVMQRHVPFGNAVLDLGLPVAESLPEHNRMDSGRGAKNASFAVIENGMNDGLTDGYAGSGAPVLDDPAGISVVYRADPKRFTSRVTEDGHAQFVLASRDIHSVPSNAPDENVAREARYYGSLPGEAGSVKWSDDGTAVIVDTPSGELQVRPEVAARSMAYVYMDEGGASYMEGKHYGHVPKERMAEYFPEIDVVLSRPLNRWSESDRGKIFQAMDQMRQAGHKVKFVRDPNLSDPVDGKIRAYGEEYGIGDGPDQLPSMSLLDSQVASEYHLDDKGGDTRERSALSGFLATDEVPGTLFGIPVVADMDSYSDADLEFFHDHPTAGGYYDMGEDDHETEQDAKGGRGDMANFLATDDVPESLFGIPIVADRMQYTDEDIVFFEEHPDAGGYYDMGDGAS